jgi:hypothetical protein
VKKGRDRNGFRMAKRTNPRSHWKSVLDDEIKWLNMDSKPDKDCEKRGDIVLLSEIIVNSSYWPDVDLTETLWPPFAVISNKLRTSLFLTIETVLS